MEERLEIGSLNFPVMLFEDGYVFVAQTALELQATKASAARLEDIRRRDWHIIDSSGNLTKVIAWKEGAKPARLNALWAFITRTIYQTPVFEFEQKHSVQSFVEHIEPMLLEYRMYGNGYGDDRDAYLKDLRKISSFPALFAFIEDAV